MQSKYILKPTQTHNKETNKKRWRRKEIEQFIACPLSSPFSFLTPRIIIVVCISLCPIFAMDLPYIIFVFGRQQKRPKEEEEKKKILLD